MKDTNYITILGWMTNRLGLSGNDLLVYAVIYGFSQDEESAFRGSMTYLANSLNVSKRAVFDVLNRLVKKGLIIKEETLKNGQKYCDYRTPKDPQSTLPNPQKGGDEESSYPMQILHGGSANSAWGGDANSAPHITNSYISKDTAAAAAENPDQTDPPETATAEIDTLKQEFKRLDPALIFDQSFYPRAAAFLAQSGLDPGYLSWLHEYCVKKKPQSLAGYYHTVFFEERLVELYREYLRSRPPPPDRPVPCPVCGTEHPADRDCPECGLESKDRNIPEAVAKQKRLYALPKEKREAYEREQETLYSQRAARFGKDFPGFFKSLQELGEKYGLGP